MFKALFAAIILCTFASRVSATTAAVNHPGSLPILLGTDKVRSVLKLDSLQRALLDSLRDEYKSVSRKLANPMPVTAQERAAAESKLLRLNERFNKRALSVLNEDQRETLSEIEGNVLGATMVYAPSMQAKLGLTEQHKRQLEDIRKRGIAYVGKINRKFEEGKISQQHRLQLLRNRRVAQHAEILAVLTSEQRSAILALEGKKLAS